MDSGAALPAETAPLSDAEASVRSAATRKSSPSWQRKRRRVRLPTPWTLAEVRATFALVPRRLPAFGDSLSTRPFFFFVDLT